MQWPTPDCSKAGATIHTSPHAPAISCAMCVSASSPGALIPSSLVRRIRIPISTYCDNKREVRVRLLSVPSFDLFFSLGDGWSLAAIVDYHCLWIDHMRQSSMFSISEYSDVIHKMSSGSMRIGPTIELLFSLSNEPLRRFHLSSTFVDIMGRWKNYDLSQASRYWFRQTLETCCKVRSRYPETVAKSIHAGANCR